MDNYDKIIDLDLAIFDMEKAIADQFASGDLGEVYGWILYEVPLIERAKALYRMCLRMEIPIPIKLKDVIKALS